MGRRLKKYIYKGFGVFVALEDCVLVVLPFVFILAFPLGLFMETGYLKGQRMAKGARFGSFIYFGRGFCLGWETESWTQQAPVAQSTCALPSRSAPTAPPFKSVIGPALSK